MMMKKMMFMAATAALVFASCSSDTEGIAEVSNSGNLVAFRTNMDKVDMTRAALSTAGTITNFSAFAFLQANNLTTSQAAGWGFMEENAVTRLFDNSWMPAQAKYWPIANNGYPLVHFVCYSPAGARNLATAMTHVAGANPSLSYKVPTTNQVDFLIGTKTVTPNGSNDYAPVLTPKVIIQFKHALSVVQFQAVNTSPDAIFVVSAISLINFKNIGSGSIDISSNSISWSSNTYSAPANFSEYAASIPATGVSILYDAADAANAGNLITTDNEGIIILPQKITAGTSYIDTTSGMFVKVVYYGMDRSGDRFTIGTPGADANGVVTKYFPLTGTTTSTFAPNTKYVYKLTFNAGKIVEFAPPTIPIDWGNSTVD